MPLDFCLLAANAALCYNVAKCTYATLDLDLDLDLVGRLAANPTSAKAPLVGSKESQGAVIQLSHNALERRGMSVLGREHGLRALIALKLCPALTLLGPSLRRRIYRWETGHLPLLCNEHSTPKDIGSGFHKSKHPRYEMCRLINTTCLQALRPAVRVFDAKSKPDDG